MAKQRAYEQQTKNGLEQQQTQLHQAINAIQLAGLQYFNLAVYHYNQQHYQLAQKAIQKAILLYPCVRNIALHQDILRIRNQSTQVVAKNEKDTH